MDPSGNVPKHQFDVDACPGRPYDAVNIHHGGGIEVSCVVALPCPGVP